MFILTQEIAKQGGSLPRRKGTRFAGKALNWLRRDARSHRARYRHATPTLHIVGDLFDIWKACGRINFSTPPDRQLRTYRSALALIGRKNQGILRVLKGYADDGNRVIFAIGNHDMEVRTHRLEGLARRVTGINDLEICEAFIERRLNMIGLHGHQADIHNAAKTIRGRWVPGEIVVRNGNREWLKWSKRGWNLRMFVLSLDAPGDGPPALEELLEHGHISTRQASRLVREMATALRDARIRTGLANAVLSSLANLGTNPTIAAVRNALIFRVETLKHFTIGAGSRVVVDGDEESGNESSRRLFHRIYAKDSGGQPQSLSDSSMIHERRIIMNSQAQWRIHRATQRMGAIVSVAGHTHVPELSGGSSNIYLNTGSWCDRWKFDTAQRWDLGIKTIRYAYPVSAISRIYKLYVGRGVHEIVVEIYNFDGQPRLLARRRLRVQYS